MDRPKSKRRGPLHRDRTPLFAFFACVFALAAVPASADRYGVNYTRELSYGFRDGEDYYFIVEYRVWQRRRPIWFIMPIERGSRVFHHEIYLYRYRADSDRLEKIATLRDTINVGTNIKQSRFVRTTDGIVFSLDAGRTDGIESVYDVFVLDPSTLSLSPAGPEQPVPRDSELFQRYFGEYRTPFTANPGIVGITELRTDVLRAVKEDDWRLPRTW